MRFSVFIGNILEHYDKALFGLLAPFIAPHFFAGDPVTSLILTYAILPLGLLTRPLGSIFFGRLGDTRGRSYALFYSLLGTACATFALGCIPSYQSIGILAPLLLAIIKMTQNFFAAAEEVGAGLYILEQTPKKNHCIASGWYNTSWIIGYLTASASITIVSAWTSVEHTWHLFFWAGSLTSIPAIILRFRHIDINTNNIVVKYKEIPRVVWQNRRSFMTIILVAGMSYVTYDTVFVLMNGLIPLVTSIKKAEVMQANTLLLIGDMLLLPGFGYIAAKIGKERLMKGAALVLALAICPLLQLLEGSTFTTALLIRTAIMALGCAYAAPYQAWAIEQIAPEHRYMVLALGAAVSSQCIGAPVSALTLWLYQQTGYLPVAGVYIALIAALSAYTMSRLHNSMIVTPA